MKKILKILLLVLVVSLVTALIAELPYIRTSDDILNDLDTDGETEYDYTKFAINPAVVPSESVNVSAKSCILCTSDGLVIYEKQADVPLPMASITKVMSTIVALENIDDLKQKVQVPQNAVGIEGSSVYLKAGETVDYEMLLYSSMLESANDAVTALAISVSGSTDAFVEKMNIKASEIGMTSTVFKNPHGLSDDGHYTTSRDYAKLMSYALENDDFVKIISTKKIVFSNEDNSASRVLTNHNRLLNTYVGMIGGKTGFTKSSGRTLVTAAERNGTVLICVTINASDDWNDHTSLFNKGFDTVKTVTLDPGECQQVLPIACGKTDKAYLTLTKPLRITVPKDSEVDFKFYRPHLEFAPVNEGEKIGKLVYFVDGKAVGEVEMTVKATVDAAEVQKRNGLSEKLKSLLFGKGKTT